MTDDTEVIESLRAVAAWLNPPGSKPDLSEREVMAAWLNQPASEPDLSDGAAVRAYQRRIDGAVETLGALVEWNPVLLRRAVGEPLGDDEEAPSWHIVLLHAAIRAEHLHESIDTSAVRLARNALFAATVAGDDTWARWVDELACHDSRDRRAVLALARSEVAFEGLRTGDGPEVVDRARRMLADAQEQAGSRGD